MNKTSIEWCDYTWNPVTGCFHVCRNIYCYNTMKSTSPLNRFGARYIGTDGQVCVEKSWRKRETGKVHVVKNAKEIYGYGFDPTFYPHRLNEPLKIKQPSKIFVVDTGDLFGSWVPIHWVEQIIDVVKQCDRHIFMFLTKNPKRYQEFDFPGNCWLGSSVNNNKDCGNVEMLKQVTAKIKYLSIEPLLGPVTCNLKGIQWIIIGAQTGKNPLNPERGWVDGLLKQAERHRIPVFIKTNIEQFCDNPTQEFPK